MNSQQVFAFFLKNLGLTEQESSLVVTLVQKGPSTILSLSRLTGINRTKIYRLVERLEKIGLINEIIDENKKLLKPVELNKLELFVKQEEQKVNRLRQTLPEIASLMPVVSTLTHPTTKVIFYRGEEGVRQQGWNTLSAKSEIVGFTYRIYAEITGQKFAEDWANEIVNRNLHFREILCDEYFKSTKDQIKHKQVTLDNKNFETRYIPNRILKIPHQMDIYDNVVSIYNWYEGEVFGVEIYNEKVAAMQKQFFEIVWKMAKKIPTRI